MNKKIKIKTFVYVILSIFGLFVLYHLLVWELYTSKIFQHDDKSKGIGDIGRISYQVDSLYPRKVEYKLPQLHMNHKQTDDYNNIDMITLGDSFSNGGAGGLNAYYQDYLATEYNIKILNLRKLINNDYDMFTLVLSLYNSGWLEKYRPKSILIESSERGVYQRFTNKLDLNVSEIEFNSMVETVTHESPYVPELLQINTANYKIPYYTMKYHFNNHAHKNVGKAKLSKDLFSLPNFKNQLLFHYSDIRNMENNKNKIIEMNKNFNQLANILKKLDIKLFFMPAVDKYDLYSSFIIDNGLPHNIFFEEFRNLKKDYIFIDTKAILLNLLNNNVKDVFYPDDTHWSYKASEAIVKDSEFSILNKKK